MNKDKPLFQMRKKRKGKGSALKRLQKAEDEHRQALETGKVCECVLCLEQEGRT